MSVAVWSNNQRKRAGLGRGRLDLVSVQQQVVDDATLPLPTAGGLDAALVFAHREESLRAVVHKLPLWESRKSQRRYEKGPSTEP